MRIFLMNKNIIDDSSQASSSTNTNNTTSSVNDTSDTTRARWITVTLLSESFPLIVPPDVQHVPIKKPTSTSTRQGKIMKGTV